MTRVDLAEAKAQLSQLIEKAAAGEIIHILRRGKAVAQITKVDDIRRPVDVALLRSVTSETPEQPQSAGDFVRAMRASDRY